jgi:PD-(D/E)XK nuclease superfamily
MSVESANQLVRASAVITSYRRFRKEAAHDVLFRARAIVSRHRMLLETASNRFIESNRRILKSWESHREELRIRNRMDGRLFNPLRFFPIGETKHSELLGYLLKPEANHGQGNTFLLSFLKMLDVPEPERGQWSVTVESSRVDIMIRRTNPSSVIIIENKSHGAVDQYNQLYRYWYKHIHLNNPLLDYDSEDTKRAFQIIYLPGIEGKTPEHHSLCRPGHLNDPLPLTVPITPKLLSFGESIADWVAITSQNIPTENHRLRAYLEFYKELCQSL